MTDIRTAILRAADHIERNPGEFDFSCVRIPAGCGTPGCALGWIGYFAGIEGTICRVAKNGLMRSHCPPHLMPVEQDEFYSRMNAVCGTGWWRLDASTCARGLRLYADRYHPALPQSVTRIFAMSNDELRRELEDVR